ncbi:CSC1-like protein HYP1 isoform X2 [Aristolochia californica]|uniref:CSC1-like protein HYP1 isoform X2 n=1 Tax=Aristolochia californica TaxID=171875 RepID=UPI0035D7E19A
MIVSALLTAVGINLGLCLLFFTLYSILRKQPGNIKVYAPRLVAAEKSQESSHFDIQRLLPSPGWVRRAWMPSEDELLALCGLDAVVFMRVFIFSFRVFSVAAFIGVFVLLPLNYVGNQLKDTDFSDIPHKSLEVFNISNVNNGSPRLWVHFCAAYLITGVVCYLLYYEYDYISSKRIAYLYSLKPQPHQFTVLVRGIPPSADGSFSESIERFFSDYHSSTYLSHIVVRHSNKLQHLIDAESIYKRLTHLKSVNGSRQSDKRDGFLGMFGKRINLADYEKKLEDLEENVRLAQSNVTLAGKEVPAAFVCFKSRYGAAIASHMQQSINPTEWITEQAPEPQDVYWPFFSASFLKRWISKMVVVIATIILTSFFLIPVVFVQGLTNLDQLQILLPFMKHILNITIVSQVVTGYLPSLILQLFLSFVPPIMMLFSSIQGYVSHSEIEKSACGKVLWFTIWNVFFANVLSGSAFSQAELFLEPKNIPSKLAVAVPEQASFFIAYVVTSGWTNLASELTRIWPLFEDFMGRHCFKCTSQKFEVPSIAYHSHLPKVLFFGLLGLTYFLLAPLILPFILTYYCLGYIIYRNQFLNLYSAKFETAGKFWPIVHCSTIFSLILMHAIAIGIFSLKKLPLASSLTLPLPVLTLLFHDYCRKRFLPNFKAYPTESLIKRDRQDQNDPAIGDFFEKLVTAYRDPAMEPIQYSKSEDGRSSPLLSDHV